MLFFLYALILALGLCMKHYGGGLFGAEIDTTVAEGTIVFLKDTVLLKLQIVHGAAADTDAASNAAFVCNKRTPVFFFHFRKTHILHFS